MNKHGRAALHQGMPSVPMLRVLHPAPSVSTAVSMCRCERTFVPAVLRLDLGLAWEALHSCQEVGGVLSWNSVHSFLCLPFFYGLLGDIQDPERTHTQGGCVGCACARVVPPQLLTSTQGKAALCTRAVCLASLCWLRAQSFGNCLLPQHGQATKCSMGLHAVHKS